MPQRIMVAANRLPVKLTKRKVAFTFQPSFGGLASGLTSLHKVARGDAF